MKFRNKHLRPPVDPASVQEIGQKVFNGVETFYRDTDVCRNVLEHYRPGLVIQETGFMDVSSVMDGLASITRYHVVTNQHASLKPSFAMYAASTFPQNCYFKVVDAFATNLGNLVTLLHIDESEVSYFATQVHPAEEALAVASRERFLEALKMKPSTALHDDYWKRRTAFPIGINDRGEYFFEFDYSPYPHLNPHYQQESIWKRVFSICQWRKTKKAS